MARHKFEKGNKLGGRKPLPDDLKEAKRMDYEKLLRTIISVRGLTKAEATLLDPAELTLGEQAILKAYQKLDYNNIKVYEDRLFGRAKESVEITGDSSNPLAFKIEVVPIKSKDEDTDTRHDSTDL